MSNLDDIRSRFLVDDSEYEDKKIAAIIELANRFIKVSKSGNVHFEQRDLTNKDKVALVFIGRFLGSRLDSDISKEVENDEVRNMTHLDVKQISARISELKRERLLERSAPATHRVISLFAAERFLENLRGRGNP